MSDEHDDEEMLIGEDKGMRFKRLATKRVKAALDKIRLVGNCSAKSSYAYSDEQIEHIEKTLLEAVDKTMVRFRPVIKAVQDFEL